MAQTKSGKRPRKPGSGRKPWLATTLADVDVDKLREFIDRHQGVVLRMVDDVAGQKSCGLVSDRPLSRVTLALRLEMIRGFKVFERGGDVSAADYAHAARVKAGLPGPRKNKVARKVAAKMRASREELLVALSTNPTKEAAAAAIGLGSRNALNALMEEYGLTEEHVNERRKEIACGQSLT